MYGKGATIHRVNAAAFPVNDNMPVTMTVPTTAWHGGLPRFLDDEVAGAGPVGHGAAGTDHPTAKPRIPGRIWLGLMAWRRRRAARIALYALDERMLSDIGLARCDIEQAVTDPVWPDAASTRSR